MNYEALPGMEDALKLVQEKKMSKEAHKKAAKAGKRWQDSDGDGKWYEKGDDVKEEKKPLPKNKMFRKAGNLGRDGSPEAMERSKKITKSLNKEEVENVEEAEQRMKAKGSDKSKKIMPDAGPAYYKKPKDHVKYEEVEIEEGMKSARDNVGASTCWKGYKAKGTKKKNGKEVPNCVPANEELEIMEGSLMESGLFSDDEVRYIIGEKFDELEELYKGKHGQSEKQYQDGRSDAGKMVSGDSKMSGSKYAQGRRTGSDAGAQPAGGSKKPASQGKMDSGSRTDLQFRKAALKKKAGK